MDAACAILRLRISTEVELSVSSPSPVSQRMHSREHCALLVEADFERFGCGDASTVGGAPFGCAVLGELAQRAGANRALFWFSLCGAITQVLWLAFRPGAITIRRP